jgi:hypothetical protein
MILEGVPAIMDALEELAKVHSFLMGTPNYSPDIIVLTPMCLAAYIPFKFIYQQCIVFYAHPRIADQHFAERPGAGRMTRKGQFFSERSRISCLPCRSMV